MAGPMVFYYMLVTLDGTLLSMPTDQREEAFEELQANPAAHMIILPAESTIQALARAMTLGVKPRLTEISTIRIGGAPIFPKTEPGK